jgi:ribosome biogenesis GTPase
MRGKPKKPPREKDLTTRFLSGSYDEDRAEQSEQFKARNKTAEQDKILRTALLRAEEESGPDLEALPLGEVVQVFSRYSEVQHAGKTYLCVTRKTLTKVTNTQLVVGDIVRFRDVTSRDESGKAGGDPDAPPEGVIEQIVPRKTILTRADSFKAITQHPIVANAQQMLIVASLRQPKVKWGLVDRMIVAAKSGGLEPIICLNKIDLAAESPSTDASAIDEGEAGVDVLKFATEVLAHYGTMGVRSLQTSVEGRIGLEALRDALRDKVTVLSGHSGVGKSSLIRAIQPTLDLRVGEVSRYTDKGRHTTTSARRYLLDIGGSVIDTPGVKVFGLWNLTRENLSQYFPDVEAGTAPQWRRESYQRILRSLAAEN